MPFHDHPDRFVAVVERFIDSTEPAEHVDALMRELLRSGALREEMVAGSEDTAPLGA